MRVPTFAAYPMSQPRQNGQAVPVRGNTISPAPYFGKQQTPEKAWLQRLNGIIGLSSAAGAEAAIGNLVITVPRSDIDNSPDGLVPDRDADHPAVYYKVWMNGASIPLLSVSLAPASRDPGVREPRAADPRPPYTIHTEDHPGKLRDGDITRQNAILKFHTETIGRNTKYTIAVHQFDPITGAGKLLMDFSSIDEDNIFAVFHNLFVKYPAVDNQRPEWIMKHYKNPATAFTAFA